MQDVRIYQQSCMPDVGLDQQSCCMGIGIDQRVPRACSCPTVPSANCPMASHIAWRLCITCPMHLRGGQPADTRTW